MRSRVPPLLSAWRSAWREAEPTCSREGYGGRHRVVRSGAVAELADIVLPPTVRRTTGRGATAVLPPGAQLIECIHARDRCRRSAISLRAVAELPSLIASPAIRRARSGGRTGVK